MITSTMARIITVGQKKQNYSSPRDMQNLRSHSNIAALGVLTEGQPGLSDLKVDGKVSLKSQLL